MLHFWLKFNRWTVSSSDWKTFEWSFCRYLNQSMKPNTISAKDPAAFIRQKSNAITNDIQIFSKAKITIFLIRRKHRCSHHQFSLDQFKFSYSFLLSSRRAESNRHCNEAIERKQDCEIENKNRESLQLKSLQACFPMIAIEVCCLSVILLIFLGLLFNKPWRYCPQLERSLASKRNCFHCDALSTVLGRVEQAAFSSAMSKRWSSVEL